MRQLILQVHRGQGAQVISEAQNQDGRNLACFEVAGADGPADLVVVHLSNSRIEPFLGRLKEMPDLQATLVPRGMLVLRPPAEQAPEQVLDVTFRSPIEIFLGGLQSVGSWKGFLGYAAAGGVVAWVGLFTGTIFLLTASMLIAPFAGPAMNMAIATARGDLELLKRTALRYFASLGVAILVAWLLSMILRQEVATRQMIDISLISSVAVLLPLVAGFAGALNLIQSERSSLVTSAATGVLVAASLAPPAATIGMAAAIGEWSMVKTGAFLLLLQLAGINFTGAIVFRLAGLSPRGIRYRRGRRWLLWTAWALNLAALAGLLTWQFWNEPFLQRATTSQRARAVVQQVVDQSGLAEIVDAELRFTRADLPGPPALLALVYVRRNPAAPAEKTQIQEQLARAIARKLVQQDFNLTPLVNVTVLEP